MTAATRAARNAAALVTREGEAVTLPSGPAQGVFDVPGPAAGALVGSEVGLAVRMGGQINPVLSLLEADAAAVAEGDTVTVRGEAWTVTRKTRPDGGLVALELMPDRGAAGSGSRYR